MTAVAPGVPDGRLAAVPGPFREIGDLKRVRVAHARGSAAERAFVRSWAALVDGADPSEVAAAECAAALAGARLAGVDAATGGRLEIGHGTSYMADEFAAVKG